MLASSLILTWGEAALIRRRKRGISVGNVGKHSAKPNIFLGFDNFDSMQVGVINNEINCSPGCFSGLFEMIKKWWTNLTGGQTQEDPQEDGGDGGR